MANQLEAPREWSGPSQDPSDEQFGDVVEKADFQTADQYDFVLVGEPYDGGHIVGRPGARKGPKVLRNELEGIKTHHYVNGPVSSIGDLGDIRYPGGRSVSETQEAFREVTTEIHSVDALPVFLGGDHSLAYSNAQPLLDEYGSVGVINIDSHTDVRSFIDGQPHTGTPFRQLLEDGLDSYVQVGAKQFGLSTPYVEYLEDQPAAVMTAEEVAHDIDAAAEEALSKIGAVDAIYVSFDVDALDTTTAPGTSSTEPGGLLSREVNQIVRKIAADDRVAGFGVYEYSPMLDRDTVTGIVAARVVAHFLSGYQHSRQ